MDRCFGAELLRGQGLVGCKKTGQVIHMIAVTAAERRKAWPYYHDNRFPEGSALSCTRRPEKMDTRTVLPRRSSNGGRGGNGRAQSWESRTPIALSGRAAVPGDSGGPGRIPPPARSRRSPSRGPRLLSSRRHSAQRSHHQAGWPPWGTRPPPVRNPRLNVVLAERRLLAASIEHSDPYMRSSVAASVAAGSPQATSRHPRSPRRPRMTRPARRRGRGSRRQCARSAALARSAVSAGARGIERSRAARPPAVPWSDTLAASPTARARSAARIRLGLFGSTNNRRPGRVDAREQLVCGGFIVVPRHHTPDSLTALHASPSQPQPPRSTVFCSSRSGRRPRRCARHLLVMSATRSATTSPVSRKAPPRCRDRRVHVHAQGAVVDHTSRSHRSASSGVKCRSRDFTGTAKFVRSGSSTNRARRWSAAGAYWCSASARPVRAAPRGSPR